MKCVIRINEEGVQYGEILRVQDSTAESLHLARKAVYVNKESWKAQKRGFESSKEAGAS